MGGRRCRFFGYYGSAREFQAPTCRRSRTGDPVPITITPTPTAMNDSSSLFLLLVVVSVLMYAIADGVLIS